MSFTATAYLFYGSPLSGIRMPWGVEAYEYEYDLWIERGSGLPDAGIETLRTLPVTVLIGGDRVRGDENEHYLAVRQSIRKVSLGGCNTRPVSFTELNVSTEWPDLIDRFQRAANLGDIPAPRWWLTLARD